MNDAISIMLVAVGVSAVWAVYLAPWIRSCSVNTDMLNRDLTRLRKDIRELQLKLCISRLKFRLVKVELDRERRDSNVVQPEISGETETAEPAVSDVGGDGDDKGI